jgi:hypothetical protein
VTQEQVERILGKINGRLPRMPPMTDEQLAQRFASEHPHIRWEPRRPAKLSDAWVVRYAHAGRHEKLKEILRLMQAFLARNGAEASDDRAKQILELALKYMAPK